MKHRVGSALIFGALLLASCRHQEPSPRAATGAEIPIILAPLLPAGDSKYRVCVGAQLDPPLYRERRDLATERQIESEEPILRRIREEVSAFFSGREKHEPSAWYQEAAKNELRLQNNDAAHLDELLKRALDASFPKERLSWNIPLPLKACAAHDERALETDPSPIFRFYLSRPIVIGNIAFVEEEAVCGGLCGSGVMKALIKRDGRWSVLAVRPTWIS